MEIQRNFADHSIRLVAYLIDMIHIILLVTSFFYFFLEFDQTLTNFSERGNAIEPRIEFLFRQKMIPAISFAI